MHRGDDVASPTTSRRRKSMKRLLAISFALALGACDCRHKTVLPTSGLGQGFDVDFGPEQVNSVKTLSNQVILQNTGDGILGLNGAQITGANASEFKMTGNIPLTL